MAPAPQPCRRPQPGLCSATGAKRRIRRVTPRGEGCPASGQFPVSFHPTEGVFLLVRHDAAAGLSMTCTYDLKHNAYRRIEGTELPLLGSSAEAAIARRNFLLHDIRFVFWTIQTAANLRSFARRRPSYDEMAAKLVEGEPTRRLHGFSQATIRQILLGIYPPAKRRNIGGL